VPLPETAVLLEWKWLKILDAHGERRLKSTRVITLDKAGHKQLPSTGPVFRECSLSLNNKST
jgi:hypothetical protein